MKIGLGTVQFGQEYGVSNSNGQTSPEEVVRILEAAGRYGIRIIDTAALYGNSESVLGNALLKKNSFDIITKTPRFEGTERQKRAKMLKQTFQRSLQYLRSASLYGLLIHHADDLISDGGNLLMDQMIELKQEGLIKKIGVSVYTARQIDQVLDKYSIDLVQLPVNVLDQRLLVSGHLTLLKKAGVEIHARSVFLQGLLLMDPMTVPPYFTSIRQRLTDYHGYLRRLGLKPVQAALGFVTALAETDCVICGVNSQQQLEEIYASRTPLDPDQFTRFAISDEKIVNPSQWKLRQPQGTL